MRAFHRFARACAALADHVVGWLLLITVVINVAQVFTRYVLNDPLFWTEEVIRFITVWFTFVGAAACSEWNEHMDMNLFAEVKSTRFQALHRALMQLLALIFALIVVWWGTRYVILNGRQTAPTTGVPMMFVYSSLAVGGGLIAVVSLRKLLLALFPDSDPDARATSTPT
jgi:TRAP-type C4-dicarboxylate transport system permease small subunit